METFVVRVYTPADPFTEADAGLHGPCGLVQHVHSGRSRTFRDAAELGRVINEATAHHLSPAPLAEVETP